MSPTTRQASSFAVIGGIGFLVDGGILTLLHSVYQFELLHARLVSFGVAVTVTWLLNRQRTFADRKDSRAVREWGRYALVNGAGALLNMGVFFWLVSQYEVLANSPLIPLAIASMIALGVNFFASKHLVFGYPGS